jgi:hypothetical protein
MRVSFSAETPVCNPCVRISQTHELQTDGSTFTMLLLFHFLPLIRTLLTSLITVLTLVETMTRPLKCDEAKTALAGATLLYDETSLLPGT